MMDRRLARMFHNSQGSLTRAFDFISEEMGYRHASATDMARPREAYERARWAIQTFRIVYRFVSNRLAEREVSE